MPCVSRRSERATILQCLQCIAMTAGTRNIFEKVLSLVALWMVGYSDAETAQPGMKSVQPVSSSKQSDAPAEAAPGVQRACQQACWQFIWHQAAVLTTALVCVTHTSHAAQPGTR